MQETEVNETWLKTGKGVTRIVEDLNVWMKERLEEKLNVVTAAHG